MKGLTYEEHERLGKELYELNKRLMYLGTKIESAYNRTTADPVYDAQETLFRFRSLMSKHVARETSKDLGIYFTPLKD